METNSRKLIRSKQLETEQQIWLSQMQSILSHNVPRFIKHIKDRGGPSSEEFGWLKCEEENSGCPMELMNRADEYLLYPKDEETFNCSLFVLVLAIAIMSFVPGGIRFFGLHFCSEIENFIAEDDAFKDG